MKKLIKTLTIVFVIGLLAAALSACSSNQLPAPEGISLDEDNNLTWETVENARSYKVEITDVNSGKTVERSTNKTKYSLDNQPEGNYEIRVRAISGMKDYTDSDWSEIKEFHRGYKTGCLYKLIKNNTEYQIEKAGQAEGTVYIEDKYRGKPVTSIAKLAFRSCSRIEHVVIGANVVEIGENAFMNCKKLVAVTIPENVESIGKGAFQSCAALAEVEIPYAVTRIAESTFAYCKALKKVSLTDNISVIEQAAFSDCVALEEITIPDKVVVLGEYAFSNCGINKVNMGKNLEFIGSFAFYKCVHLTEINFREENKIVAFGESSFADCIALSSVVIPEGVEDLGEKCFYSCEALTDVTLPQSLAHIGLYAFNGTKMYTDVMDNESNPYAYLYVGNWLTAVSARFRAEMTRITAESRKAELLEHNPTIISSEKIDDHVYTLHTATTTGILFIVKEDAVGISDGVFAQSKELTIVDLPRSVKHVGGYSFYGSAKLNQLEVPDGGLLTIGESAFYNCKKLSNPILGNRLRSIGDYAFYGCEALGNSTTGESFLPDTLERIGTDAFKNTRIWRTPDSTTGIIYAGDWVVGFDDRVTLATVSLRTGVKGIADYAFYQAYSLIGITGISGIEHIGRGAFYECYNLSMVTLNRNLTRIEDYTFYDCFSLTIGNTDLEGNPILPSELTYIGRSAFYGCSSMKSVNFRGTRVTTIGPYAFYYCESLIDVQFSERIVEIGEKAFYNDVKIETIRLPDSLKTIAEKAFYKCEGVKDLTIGSNVEVIGDYAFCGLTGIEKIDIPDSVRSIGNYAFYKCENVTDLKIGSSVEEIGNYCFYGLKKLTYLAIPESVKIIGNYAFKGLTRIRSFVIPATVESVGMHAFYGAKKATIFSDAATESGDWNTRWNSSFRPVVWGCEVSEDGAYVVSIAVTDSTFTNTYVFYDEKENNVFTAPRRKGYTFTGWATEEGGAVVYAADKITEAPVGTTLYAVWEEGEEPEPPYDPEEDDQTAPSSGTGIFDIIPADSGNGSASSSADQ